MNSFLNGAIVWDPSLSPFSIGGFEIRYYAICWMLGLLAAYLLVKRIYSDNKVPKEKFDPLFFYCFLGILAGARLGHCLFYEPAYYLAHPIEMILPIKEINGSWTFTGYAGLASHGGAIGVTIALLLYIKKTKLPFLWVLDCLGVAAPIFAALVRMGNLMNSEIIGTATDAPWGFVFVQAGLKEPHHPAQLYEAMAYILVFVLIILLYKKYRYKLGTGLFSGVTLVTIFTFRFFVECIKVEQVSFEKGMFINMGQILSLPVIAAGAYLLYRSTKIKKDIILLKQGNTSLL
jgi:prolipoprotein diacylglyceryl transferase